MTKPFDTYNGGKESAGTYQKIICQIPKCNRFIELFAGNCAITRHMKWPVSVILNDVDRSVYERLLPYESMGVIVTNDDYSGVIAKYGNDGHTTVIYCDPPYLLETRSCKKRLYKHEFTENDHIDFLTQAHNATCNVAISHYPCELYDDKLKNWRWFDFQSMTRNGMKTERLYMNYDRPTILQDFTHIGTDFHDRLRIKRKIDRLLNKLENLEELERVGLLSAVIDKYSDASAKLLTKNHI
jgi:DNA adenine methylase